MLGYNILVKSDNLLENNMEKSKYKNQNRSNEGYTKN